MRSIVRILTILLLTLLFLTACASAPPKPDPLKEELIILQKQLLELQKLQNETKLRLDESTAAVELLSTRIKSLEERQAARPVSAPQLEPVKKPAAAEAKKPAKKPVKKKKKVRRQP